MAPITPVALITGASSGIGLALTKHLLSKSWSVIMLDLNTPPSSDLPSDVPIYFHRTDVSSWDSQAKAFAAGWSRFGRLDFCALNAGIDDRDDIFGSTTGRLDEPPKKPNMKTFDVNLAGVYYGVKLAAHYMALNPLLNSSTEEGEGRAAGGKIAITTSDAGLNALPPVPQYTATKHALVGLTRALAPSALEAGVTVNAIAPSLTPSNLAPPGLLENIPRETLTKMETLLKAFDAVGRFDDFQEGWAREGPNGQIVAGRGENIYFRDELERVGNTKEVPREIAEIWKNTYKERNRRFARLNQERKE